MAVSLSAICALFSDEPKIIKKGENALESNHVKKFCFSDGIIVAQIDASMKDKTYDVKITIESEDVISSWSCSCPRGQFKCHHIATALLYCHKNISKTDLACRWVQRSSNLASKIQTVEEMYPIHRQYDTALDRPVSAVDKGQFYNDLKGLGYACGFLHVLSKEPDLPQLPVPTMENILSSKDFVEASNKRLHLTETMKLTGEDISDIASLTKGQRDNSLWGCYRKYRLTASNFGRVIKAVRRNSFPASLFQTLAGDYDLTGVKAVQWGITNEQTARDQYADYTGNQVSETGIWLSADGKLGASPDGLVNATTVLEIKCPFKYKDSTISQAITDKDFYLYIKDGLVALKHDHDYWHQVQGTMCLTGRSEAHFFVYLRNEFVIVKVSRDPLWEIMFRPMLIEFYDKYILNNLVSLSASH